jgi:uncharacterized protein (TIGR02679 family)
MNRRLHAFKEEGFIKLFEGFKSKYRSLGRMGGSVSLKGFSDGEVEMISGFLGMSPFVLRGKNKVSLQEFEKALAHSAFSDLSLLDVLQGVLGETILTKKEEVLQEEAEESLFLDRLRAAIPEAGWWIDYLQSKPAESRWIRALYQEASEELFDKIVMTFRAFSMHPKEGDFERLPFFSRRTTGNPHFFDSGGTAGRLLLHIMFCDQMTKGTTISFPRNSEAINTLLAEYGILRDDLWNFVTCQGLLARVNDSIHPVWQAAINTNTVLNVPIRELKNLGSVWPARGSNVWIVENSSVSSTIMDSVPHAPIICTHGQPRLAGVQLMDMLVENDCILHYSGDLDPEGIGIADRLKQRYGSKLHIWRMDLDSYFASLSKEDITGRLGKLDGLSDPSWEDLVQQMRVIQKAGYQEAIVGELVKDILATQNM